MYRTGAPIAPHDCATPMRQRPLLGALQDAINAKASPTDWSRPAALTHHRQAGPPNAEGLWSLRHNTDQWPSPKGPLTAPASKGEPTSACVFTSNRWPCLSMRKAVRRCNNWGGGPHVFTSMRTQPRHVPLNATPHFHKKPGSASGSIGVARTSPLHHRGCRG